MQRSVRFVLLPLVLVLILSSVVAAAGKPAAPSSPAVKQRATPQQQAIIIDHTCTDLGQIPPYWIEQAKDLLRIFYAHTSHGSQLDTGMHVLMQDLANGGLYNFLDDGTVQPGYLSLDDHGDDMGDLGNPNFTAWEAQTRSYLDDPAHADRNVTMWSWCGEASWASEADIDTYLSLMTGLENDYPNVRFIYMTGHLDGTGVGGQLDVNNDHIRTYVAATGKVLFDFADIESYNPDGEEFLSRYATDLCEYDSDGDGIPTGDANWAVEWCDAHPGDSRCTSCECAHSQSLNCNMKARAVWWMLARLAGWPGPGVAGPDLSPSGKEASTVAATAGDTVDYTIRLVNDGDPFTGTVALTDTIPVGLEYISGTLQATAGMVDDSSAPTLLWSGDLVSGPVTITYAVTVTAVGPQALANTARIVLAGYDPLERSAVVQVDPVQVYLPVVWR